MKTLAAIVVGIAVGVAAGVAVANLVLDYFPPTRINQKCPVAGDAVYLGATYKFSTDELVCHYGPAPSRRKRS